MSENDALKKEIEQQVALNQEKEKAFEETVRQKEEEFKAVSEQMSAKLNAV